MPRLRLATLDDLPLLVRHRRLMWGDIAEHAEETLAAADPAYRRWARTRLRSGRLVAWVVEEKGGPVASGCVWLQPVQPRPGRPFEVQPYLLSMFTEPAHRGKGHAARIVEAAMAWAQERGHPYLSLHASAAGRPIYERMGFVQMPELRVTLRPAPRKAETAARGKAPGRAHRAAPAPSPRRSPTTGRRSPARPARRRSTGS